MPSLSPICQTSYRDVSVVIPAWSTSAPVAAFGQMEVYLYSDLSGGGNTGYAVRYSLLPPSARYIDDTLFRSFTGDIWLTGQSTYKLTGDSNRLTVFTDTVNPQPVNLLFNARGRMPLNGTANLNFNPADSRALLYQIASVFETPDFHSRERQPYYVAPVPLPFAMAPNATLSRVGRESNRKRCAVSPRRPPATC